MSLCLLGLVHVSVCVLRETHTKWNLICKRFIGEMAVNSKMKQMLQAPRLQFWLYLCPQQGAIVSVPVLRDSASLASLQSQFFTGSRLLEHSLVMKAFVNLEGRQSSSRGPITCSFQGAEYIFM